MGRYRRAVAEQLRTLGVDAIEQTTFPADYLTIQSMLKNKINGSDAVICLIGPVCGEGPRTGPPRSWTQIEYDVAKELGKRIFVFSAGPNCPFDDTGRDTDEQRERQCQHIATLRRHERCFRDFQSEEGVRMLTGEVVARIRDEIAAPTDLWTQVTAFYPTPLAGVFADHFRCEEERRIRILARQALRWATLLAVHDGLVHGIWGHHDLDAPARAGGLLQPLEPDCAHALLQLACPPDAGTPSDRFVPEFAGWGRRLGSLFAPLLKSYELLSRLNVPPRRSSEAIRTLKEQLAALYRELDFLGRYLLLTVSSDDSEESLTAHLLRGVEACTVAVSADADSSLPLAPGRAYLLSLDRREAIGLWPVFWPYTPRQGCDLWGWYRLRRLDGSFELDMESFRESDQGTVRDCDEGPSSTDDDASRVADLRATLGAWLGPNWAKQVLGEAEFQSKMPWRGKLLDEESWQAVLKKALPFEQVDLVLGRRYRLSPPAVHRGTYADLFEATEQVARSEGPGAETASYRSPRLLHLLREDVTSDQTVRAWFQRRRDCWSRLEDPAVLRILPDSATDAAAPRAYIVTDLVPDARSLESWLDSGQPIPDEQVLGVLTVAARICQEAHSRGIRLMAIPPRHLLVDAGGALHLTGFESALPADSTPWLGLPSSRKYFLRFCKDWSTIAPEVEQRPGTPAPTADVFALGILLARLRGLSAQPADTLAMGDWSDRWKCLAFHCLARDPNLRFQSPEQLLTFLGGWLHRKAGEGAPTVRVPSAASPIASGESAEVRGFHMALWPVTNDEYLHFCGATGYPLPQHLDPDGAGRLAAPWLPVTHVSLTDAEKYASWLSRWTGASWRIPTEREWLWAATLGEDRTYPWGNRDAVTTLANYGPAFRGPTVVGAFPAGRAASGCLDMAGNVWEWCSDRPTFDDPRRILKGGAYDFGVDGLRVSSRHRAVVLCRGPHVGFRLLCEDQA